MHETCSLDTKHFLGIEKRSVLDQILLVFQTKKRNAQDTNDPEMLKIKINMYVEKFLRKLMINTITVNTFLVFSRRAEKLRLFEESSVLRQKENGNSG